MDADASLALCLDVSLDEDDCPSIMALSGLLAGTPLACVDALVDACEPEAMDVPDRRCIWFMH